MVDIPETLFKYLHPDRIEDVLKTKTLRFTQPSMLNDPWELKERYRIYHEKYIGVLSLSGSNNQKLMWTHYADSHRGFIIEFDYTALETLNFLSSIKAIPSTIIKNNDKFNFNPVCLQKEHTQYKKIKLNDESLEEETIDYETMGIDASNYFRHNIDIDESFKKIPEYWKIKKVMYQKKIVDEKENIVRACL